MSLLANFREILFRTITFRYLQARAREHMGKYPRIAILSFDFIGHNINIFGRYEKQELDKLLEILRAEGRTGTALDIGANIGNHSLFFAGVFASVHSFEPNSLVLPLLKYNLRTSPNVFVHPFGASSTNGTVDALVPFSNAGGARIAVRNQEENEERTTFEVRRLDEMPELTNIDFIKIDVEGHELQAFDGMANLILDNSPLIAFEQNANEFINRSSQAIEKLRKFGYSYFYEITTGQSRIPQYFPRWMRIPLRLVEAIFADPGPNAFMTQVLSFEYRSYQMLLASRTPLNH